MQKTRSRPSDSKETRINVRINREQKAVIARAARLRRTTISNFVIGNALQAASQVVNATSAMRARAPMPSARTAPDAAATPTPAAVATIGPAWWWRKIAVA